ncbi:3-deoxy-D-manno-oct-2-ulosonic acid (Kdo) hydroxylase [Candidatus Methylacidiphilum fumarolicum]|uniref:3-deoxy-D-manno-oct-2-ulosonic acid (Kdo) hydroxylase n=2 Tax=Candidatus Methylacidiphilum fumarolicum TaxID=591154 RepID=I0JWM1_METFB|nr:Kdo hydroxylase family protein [Candidatus Methylacidiphilum fumarolicum]MBW6414333.1 Kdo hydroxylase family protein [Candidatus Methylacidiphilum fumarolicum]TFE65829.1 3-deoxy-D-manno-oct-2-ulosonic acid (Kdo) hydroxylase [Candidatus Methylacidiphilum fumarolicum]TFE71198.1 3-deoxy-D-manno-oct-2-ulosonic acid (Kdo) hydroxylase [Candidatus Methylacidiphilum fumarolicum]TFE71649.1 3-deoxy-D-manno-oct-2-ulosonic acid (Kdo) hydroxylase [Candidatus Methylacidiphilum fumarolicum]TFE76883.1 3-de
MDISSFEHPVIQFEADRWDAEFSKEIQEKAIESIENGSVLFFPRLNFSLLPEETKFLEPSWVSGAKNISYDPRNSSLKGAEGKTEDLKLLSGMLKRYAQKTKEFLHLLFPFYGSSLRIARTSFRPVEISGRPTSPRKDDTRLHVDAFPSSPTGGERILRVFSNINPSGKPRSWRIGEPFPQYLKHLLPQLESPTPGKRFLLYVLGITKGYRSLYDHYMLELHDKGKLDLPYQKNSPQVAFDFPAGSTWIVFTDQVLHAVDKGQFLLEQTFHIKIEALKHPEKSPLKLLEAALNKKLVSV